MNILVDEFRRQFPSDQRSDEDITLLLAARDDGSFSQYPDFVADVKRITALRAATSELNTPSYAQEFSRALKRGAGSLKESAYGSAALAADVVGLEGARDAALEKYVESRDESAGENAATVGRVEDVDTIDKGVRFALAKGGELIPQVGEALVVGAAGALAGSAAGPGGTAVGGAAGLTEGFVARQSAKAIIKAGIEKILGKTAVDAATKQVVKDQLEKVAAKELIEGALHPITEKLLASQIKSSVANMGSLGANVANFYGIGAGTIYGDLSTREGVDPEDARNAALIGGSGLRWPTPRSRPSSSPVTFPVSVVMSPSHIFNVSPKMPHLRSHWVRLVKRWMSWFRSPLRNTPTLDDATRLSTIRISVAC